MSAPPVYDVMGRGYARVRRADPRLEQAIWQALGDARTVLNVGAGTGSYEPCDRWVLAVEPSEVMIAQRPPGAAPVITAHVEQLPLADRSIDAAMAILTLHHWQDLRAGLTELQRVIRERIVIVTIDVQQLAQLWIVRDYLPELIGQHMAKFPSIEDLCRLLAGPEVEVLPVPRDCTDGFMAALWARPEAYLDPAIRAATSPWYDLPDHVVDRALERLWADLQSGAWHQRYASLLGLPELDVGLRLITTVVSEGA
ncbi:MAG TPA: class I SAM-dependent methyltransferase [Solirubrobacteraceae bacterium]|nr:class I SAM-dependent methyltransferase [Solirubrobacteraceae bacterium]